MRWEWAPVPGIDVLDALHGQWAVLHGLFTQVPVAGWDAPTRLAGWGLEHLLAHVALGPEQVLEMIAAPAAVVVGQTALDWYVGSDRYASDIDRQVRDLAQQVSPNELIARFQAATSLACRELRRVGAARVLGGASSGITALDYAVTRIVEAVVHGFDLCAASSATRIAAPDGQRICAAYLAGVLNQLLEGRSSPAVAMGDDEVWLGDGKARISMPLSDWIEIATARRVPRLAHHPAWLSELPVLR